jgi:hypothetical protein
MSESKPVAWLLDEGVMLTDPKDKYALPLYVIADGSVIVPKDEYDELRQNVVAFLAPWAVRYQQDYRLDGLHPLHFDILEKAGARMDDFKRANLPVPPASAGERD